MAYITFTTVLIEICYVILLFLEDINEGRIFYLLNSGSNATDDAFFFKLRDKGTVSVLSIHLLCESQEIFNTCGQWDDVKHFELTYVLIYLQMFGILYYNHFGYTSVFLIVWYIYHKSAVYSL